MLTFAATIGAGVDAFASSPTGAWSFPDEVTILEAGSAQPEVVIQGWFLVWSGDGPVGDEWGNRGFEDARYGRMYYRCKAGEKDMCTLQWGELQTYATNKECAGWGNQNEAAGTLRAADGELAGPDVYPINQGVTTGFTPCNHLKAAMEASPEPSVETVPDLPPDERPEAPPELGPEPGPEPMPETGEDVSTSFDTVPPQPDIVPEQDTVQQLDSAASVDTGATPGKSEDDDGNCASGGLGLVPALVAALALALARRRAG